MNKLKFFLTIALSLLTLSSQAIFAAPKSSRVAQATPSAMPSKARVNRCEALNNNISAYLNNLNARKDNHVAVYTNAHTRWVELSARLKTQGLDTAKFDTDLKTLEGMISDLKTDYALFTDSMSTTLDTDCETNLVQFKSRLKIGRTQLADFRTQAKKIHDFIQNTIRLDLRALRQQKPSPTPTI